MKRQNVLKSLIRLLIISTLGASCGLIEKFKTPDQPTESKNEETATTETPTDTEADDLFSKTMNETQEETLIAGTDAPANITADKPSSLEDEFGNEALKEPTANTVTETQTQQMKVEEPLPEIKSEMPQILVENTNNDAGKIMSYKVQKGETLMQIAFKIYGDVSKWKDIKQMNGSKLSKSSALRSNMELKYKAPAQVFVWNPEGTPHLIKTGETLGTISNSVYQTPKKWKQIWENNKPLIKNPNVIYAGFTLYYQGNNMANYVQPKTIQRKLETKSKDIEEVKIDEAISKLDVQESNEIDLTKGVQSAALNDVNENINQEVKADEIADEALIR